jgi:hypothetical protein
MVTTQVIDPMSNMIHPMLTSLKIWQQNLNKLSNAHWDIILLQEPYLDSYGNSKATTNWHVIYPSSHLTIRFVILVNMELDTNYWYQLYFNNNNDITAVRFKGSYGHVSIFNLYNDLNHSNSLTALDNFVTRNHKDIYDNECCGVSGSCECKGNLTNLRRELHLSLAEGNPK